MEKIFANLKSEKGLIFRISKRLLLLKINKTPPKNSVEKWAKYLNIFLSKEEIQMAKKHMKNAQHYWPLENCKSKPRDITLYLL